MKEKRILIFMLIFFASLIFTENINADLPDIKDLQATAYGNSITLSWSYTAYGSSETCQDECTPGIRECNIDAYGAYGYQECIDLNNDGCFEWSSNICNVDEICQDGNCLSSYGSYGGYGTGDTIKNVITGNSIKDNFKEILNNITEFFKKLFGLGERGAEIQKINLGSYNFEIYKNDLLSSYGLDYDYCDENNNCEYLDENLPNGVYSYYVRVSDGIQSKDSNSINVEISSEETCENECNEGSQRCIGNYEYQICGNYDQDDCLEWGDDIDLQCDQGDVCIIQNNEAVCGVPDTQAPSIISVNPSDGSRNVPVNVNLVVTFSEAMDKASVENALFLTDIDNQVNINGVNSWDEQGRILTFAPNSNLQNNAQHIMTVSADAKDLAGNNLANEFTAEFTTITTTLCNSGELKQGTECLVCNLQGTDYGADDSKCDLGKFCSSDGICKEIKVEIYPKSGLFNVNSNKRFDVYGDGRNYIWSKEGEVCSISQYGAYGIASFSGLGYCNITVTDVSGVSDKSYVRVIEDQPIIESEEISLNSQDNADIILDDNTNLGLSLTALTTSNIKINSYNSNLVQDPSSLISANKFFSIEADKEISDNLDKFIINASYDKNNLGDINENSLKIYYYNIQNNGWIDEGNNIISSYGSNYYVSSEFNHLSLFGLFGESISQPPSDSGGSPGGDGGGGGGGGRGKCLEDWKCDPWSLCINGKQARECKDAKFCNNYYPNIPKPSEISSCTLTLEEKEKEQQAQKEEIGGEIESQGLIKGKSRNLLIYIIIITFLIVAIASFIFRKKIFKHNEKPEIDDKPKNYSDKVVDLVKNIRDQGYGDYQIKEELYKKGWSKSQIDEIFRRL